MRELQLYPPKRGDTDVVRRLQFAGGELFAWVGEAVGFGGDTTALYATTPGGGPVREVLPDGWFWDYDDAPSGPVLSPDGRFLLVETDYGSGDEYVVHFEDLARQDEPGFHLPDLPGAPLGVGGLVFTPDGAEVLAVRNVAQIEGDTRTRDVKRFALSAYRNPPLRYEDKVNPLTGQPYRTPVYNQRWRAAGTLPPGRHASAAALSADGRLLAVGDLGGGVLVFDLKTKKAVAEVARKWAANVASYRRVAEQVAFAAGGAWVLTLANGRLFANPLGQGKEWKSGPAVGAVHDFAVHPSGRFACAACADGQARYLDPRTGAVTAAFKWAKRSKKPLHAVAFAPDGLLCAVGGVGGKVFIWDVDA